MKGDDHPADAGAGRTPGYGQGLTPKYARPDRRNTRTVRVGGLVIGGRMPVVVQEMAVSSPRDLERAAGEILSLEEIGCRLVRIALPDIEAARAVKALKERVRVPLVGDVHFDERIALEAIARGIDKLRLNPGNIGNPRGVEGVARAAAERGVPIRVGVNAGSLEKDLLERHGGPVPEALVESALRQVAILERSRFSDIVISIKSSDVRTTVDANLLISSRVDYPLHVGVSEAGFGEQGTVRSAVGIGAILMNGIGDTVRVSLTSRDRASNLALCRGILDSLRIPWI